MARAKKVHKLKLLPFNPAKPDKFGMRIAVPVSAPKRKKPRKSRPEKLLFSAGMEHIFYRKAIPATIRSDPLVLD